MEEVMGIIIELMLLILLISFCVYFFVVFILELKEVQNEKAEQKRIQTILDEYWEYLQKKKEE